MHVIITIVIEAVSITLYERKHTNALISKVTIFDQAETHIDML